jgi:hypothetical protein
MRAQICRRDLPRESWTTVHLGKTFPFRRGTDGSNPSPSSGESTNFRFRGARPLEADAPGGRLSVVDLRGSADLAGYCATKRGVLVIDPKRDRFGPPVIRLGVRPVRPRNRLTTRTVRRLAQPIIPVMIAKMKLIVPSQSRSPASVPLRGGPHGKQVLEYAPTCLASR